MLTSTQKLSMVDCIRKELPDVVAIYIFGSLITEHARHDSDLDLALLIESKINPSTAFTIKTELSAQTKRDVDLVDLLRADTVTRAQVITSSETLYCADSRFCAFFETNVLSQYAELNEERKEILADIVARGSIHG